MSSGARRRFRSAPSTRASNGAAQTERPPVRAPGASPRKSGTWWPSMKRKAVCSRWNCTIAGPCVSKASMRAASYCAPRMWRR